ncbi:MAG: hypothetical protein JWO24_4041 [Rhodospirillales bacterium]|nr:hypothetical protein [Rhodospirillales bacterium]
MTEAEARALPAGFDGVGGLKAWIAGGRRKAAPDGWTVTGVVDDMVDVEDLAEKKEITPSVPQELILLAHSLGEYIIGKAMALTLGTDTWPILGVQEALSSLCTAAKRHPKWYLLQDLECDEEGCTQPIGSPNLVATQVALEVAEVIADLLGYPAETRNALDRHCTPGHQLH